MKDIAFSDVDMTASHNATPSFVLKPTALSPESFAASLGPFSKTENGFEPVPATTFIAKIKVGSLDESDLKNAQFGFIQAIRVDARFVLYSGMRSNTGSVVMEDGRFNTYPDSEKNARPWTRIPASRFKFDSATGEVTCKTQDAPNFSIFTAIDNTSFDGTRPRNYLQSVKCSYSLCCALVVEDARKKPVKRIVGHSMWDFTLRFEFLWKLMRRPNLAEPLISSASVVNSSKAKIGDFVADAPIDPDFAKMVDDSFLTREDYNVEVDRFYHAQYNNPKQSGRTDTKERAISAPNNFFS